MTKHKYLNIQIIASLVFKIKTHQNFAVLFTVFSLFLLVDCTEDQCCVTVLCPSAIICSLCIVAKWCILLAWKTVGGTKY